MQVEIPAIELILCIRWYCHFDDDVYVNIPVLMASLSRYDPFQDHVYIGRWPLAKEVLPVPELLFQDTFPVHVRAIYAESKISSQLRNSDCYL